MRWPKFLTLVFLGALLAGSSSADSLRDPFGAIGIDANSGTRIPVEGQFRDETGRAVSLGDYLGHGPVIFAPVYYRCPNLCGTTLRWLAASLAQVPLSPGTDYTVVAVSVDPREGPADAAEIKAQALAGESEARRAGFHFLTGADSQIQTLMEAIGFHYRWDSELQQYAHAAAVVVLTSQGKIARWLYGFSYGPADLRLALVEAGQGRTGSLTDQILLLCYHYNPITGRYDGLIWSVLQWVCAATALGLLGFAAWCIRRERRAKAARRQGPAP